jgi:hypothetical protein
MGFYRYIVRGFIGAGFCALVAGCGAADPESGEVDVSEAEALCTAPTYDACLIYSETNISGNCCYCNGHKGTLKAFPLQPNTYKCKF